MKEMMVRINFTYDDEDNISEFKLTVPQNMTIEMVVKKIIKEHNYLCDKDATDIYGNEGRNPIILIDYICKKYHWGYSELTFDVDIKLD